MAEAQQLALVFRQTGDSRQRVRDDPETLAFLPENQNLGLGFDDRFGCHQVAAQIGGFRFRSAHGPARALDRIPDKADDQREGAGAERDAEQMSSAQARDAGGAALDNAECQDDHARQTGQQEREQLPPVGVGPVLASGHLHCVP